MAAPPPPSPLLLLLLAIAATSVQSASSSPYNNASFQFSTQQNNSFRRTADFTLGFKRLAASSSADVDQYLLCIWRSSDLNQTALWWPSAAAFNQTAVLQSSSAKGGGSSNQTSAAVDISPAVANGTILRFTSGGNLQLVASEGSGNGGGLVLWSAAGGGKIAAVAELRNDGNLVLRDERNATVWQSFGDRRETMILAAKEGGSEDVDLVTSNSRLLTSRSSTNNDSWSSYAEGRFHVETDKYQNLYLHAVEEYYGADYVYSYGAINVSGYFSLSTGDRKYQSNDTMPISLIKLESDGNMAVYVWSDTDRLWQRQWQLLQGRCFIASPCGPFGICTENASSVTCTCPPGYSFIDDSLPSKGCRTDLNFTAICAATYASSSYSMVPLIDADYDYGDIGSVHTASSVAACADLCLQSCDCVAASFVVNGNCYIKGNKSAGILMNGYTTDTNTLLMKLRKEGSSSNNGAVVGGAAAAAGAILVLAVAAVLFVCAVKRRRRSRSGGPARALLLEVDGYGGEAGSAAIRFTRKQLVEATDSFRHLLGEGGYGKVYKGWIKEVQKEAPRNSNTAAAAAAGGGWRARKRRRSAAKALSETTSVVKAVAVKVLKSPALLLQDMAAAAEMDAAAAAEDVNVVAAAAMAAPPGDKTADKQFRAEVSTLGKIHHVNLVNLIGYCFDGGDDGGGGGDGGSGKQMMRALVFEFMERGSLDRYLTGGKKKMKKKKISGEVAVAAEKEEEEAALPWRSRYSIALGMARGIAYLHHECNPPILHSDIKPQNVLLSGDLTAKVADFGFARRFNDTKTHLTMSAVQGTRGYMAPEWLKTDEITSKVDVFSFGVVLLELVRGLCDCYRHRHRRVDDAHADADSADLEAPGDVNLPVVDWAFQYLQIVSAPPPNYTATAITTTRKASDLLDSDRPHGSVVDQSTMQGVPSPGSGDMDVERAERIRLLKVGLWCVQYAPQMRPTMQQVLRQIEASAGGAADIEMPPYPAPRIPLPPPSLLPDDDDSFASSNEPSSNFFEILSNVTAR